MYTDQHCSFCYVMLYNGALHRTAYSEWKFATGNENPDRPIFTHASESFHPTGVPIPGASEAHHDYFEDLIAIGR